MEDETFSVEEWLKRVGGSSLKWKMEVDEAMAELERCKGIFVSNMCGIYGAEKCDSLWAC